ncbi:site-2 protease family protein [Paenibacillus psychroresistens]|uniref:Site-2 protease family protein n=1 Tax=Paenibacillus psychroresistens TaxID=1778678 RepID=A0A6B8RI10_9BACL|nr:site-2 protease family protein [Paenibacillus psychroresistens]QGQ94988.1 site-2 protease family protein [Paenibacillus psychroresistens]
MTDKREPQKKNKPWWFMGAAGIFLLTKIKLLLPLLKLGTFGGTIITMAVSVWAFAQIAPIQTAVGLIVMIFIHEMGHVIASKQKGLPTSAPIFIPFLGAMINLKRNPRDAETEAYIAFGGPLLGTVGALGAFFIGWYWELPLFIYIAWIGFFLNLINLLPIHPLDGGRISVAVSRWLWLFGLTGGLFIILYIHAYVMLIFWALFAWDLYNKYVRKKDSKPRSTWGTFEVDMDPILEQGFFIPGTEHRRELAFETYSELEDGKQRVLIYWREMGLHGLLNLFEQGLIKSVYTSQIERITKENKAYLLIRCQVDYYPHTNDAYYEVAPKVRWKYGITYALLAVFLGYMMHAASKMELYIK